MNKLPSGRPSLNEIDIPYAPQRGRANGSVFRSLSWGFHEPGGHALWWLIKNSGRLHILSELAFEHLPEADLAMAMKARDTALRLWSRFGIKDIAFTVGTPEIVSDIKSPKLGFKGETIGDRLLSCGMPVQAADPDALNGWQRCQSLLRVDETGKPSLTIDPSCKVLADAIRSGLQDDAHPEDIDTPAPALLALRYGAMTWPAVDQVTPIQTIPVGSPAWYMQQARQGEYRRFGQVH